MKKRPRLIEDHAKARLAWCIERKDWTIEDWKRVIFSDECSVERGAGKRPRWVWCYKGQRFDPINIDPYDKGRDILVMVWAAIQLYKRLEIGFMERDMEAPRHGYTSWSYTQILDDNLALIYSHGTLYQQDNASIHTAEETIEWFENYRIDLLNWPTYSLDLNPIENVWAFLKDYLNQHYSHLLS